MPGLSLLPLTFNASQGKQSNPLYMHSQPVFASVCRADGEAWPLLFPMATAQLCMKTGKWGSGWIHRLRRSAWLLAWTRGSSSPSLVLFLLPPTQPHENYFNPMKERWGLGDTLLWTPAVVPLPGVYFRDKGRRVVITLGILMLVKARSRFLILGRQGC